MIAGWQMNEIRRAVPIHAMRPQDSPECAWIGGDVSGDKTQPCLKPACGEGAHHHGCRNAAEQTIRINAVGQDGYRWRGQMIGEYRQWRPRRILRWRMDCDVCLLMPRIGWNG